MLFYAIIFRFFHKRFTFETSKSKLILREYNAFYFSEIAFIGFILHEIKQGIVLFGTPGIALTKY